MTIVSTESVRFEQMEKVAELTMQGDSATAISKQLKIPRKEVLLLQEDYRTALANDQHGAIERRGAARALDRIEKRKALPDQLTDPLHVPTVGGKPHLLARCFNGFSAENCGFLQLSEIFRGLARLLNRKRRTGP